MEKICWEELAEQKRISMGQLTAVSICQPKKEKERFVHVLEVCSLPWLSWVNMTLSSLSVSYSQDLTVQQEFSSKGKWGCRLSFLHLPVSSFLTSQWTQWYSFCLPGVPLSQCLLSVMVFTFSFLEILVTGRDWKGEANLERGEYKLGDIQQTMYLLHMAHFYFPTYENKCT